jgi:hypothetical protein
LVALFEKLLEGSTTAMAETADDSHKKKGASADGDADLELPCEACSRR